MSQAEFERLLSQLPFKVPRLVEEAYTLLLFAGLILGILALVIGLLSMLRARRLQQRYADLMTGVDGSDLASLLDRLVAEQRAALRRVESLERSTASLDRDLGRISQTESGIERLREHTADMGVHAQRISGTESNLGSLSSRVADIDRRLQRAVQRVKVLRYRAFEDAGDQSFAVALLDAKGDGVVLSGLHHRSGVRVYAKPVEAEQSDFALTEEEQSVISGKTKQEA